MDFDAFARTLSETPSRRGVLAAALALLFGVASTAESATPCDRRLRAWERKYRRWLRSHPRWRRSRAQRRRRAQLLAERRAIKRACKKPPATQPAPPAQPQPSTPPPPTGQGDLGPCTMPAADAGCVKLGGGPRPYYVEGWFCPSAECVSQWCAGGALGGQGTCGVTAADLRGEIAAGRAWVLAGTPPA